MRALNRLRSLVARHSPGKVEVPGSIPQRNINFFFHDTNLTFKKISSRHISMNFLLFFFWKKKAVTSKEEIKLQRTVTLKNIRTLIGDLVL